MGNTAKELSGNYLDLLISQLRNQNPLEPMDNNQMTTQLATLAQLEHTESIDNQFQKAMTTVQLGQATQMIGKAVSYLPEDAENPVAGQVDGAYVENGQVYLAIGGQRVPFDDVGAVAEDVSNFL